MLFEEMQREPAYIVKQELPPASYLNENDEEPRVWKDKVESIRFELVKMGYEPRQSLKGKWKVVDNQEWTDYTVSISWFIDENDNKIYSVEDNITINVPNGDKQIKFDAYFTENPKMMGYHKMKKFGV
jgi:hypothetical protein